MTRDQSDLAKISLWVDEVNPFSENRKHLQSVSSGLTADESVNCDNVEYIGKNIQEKFDNEEFVKCTFKRNNQVSTLGKMKNIVKVNKQSVNIDPSKLFSRLLVISEREGDVKRHFEYELTPVPTSLFIETSMRKANKAQIILHLLKGVSGCE